MSAVVDEAHQHYACEHILARLHVIDDAVEVAIEQLRAAGKLPETFTAHKRADDVLLELLVSVAGARGVLLREAWDAIGKWYV